MTKYFLTKAETDSQWDWVSFVLIENPERLVPKIEKARARLKKILAIDPDDGDISSVTIDGDFGEFFHDVEDDCLPPECYDEDGEVKTMFIELDEQEVEKFSRPENTIKYGEIRIYGRGLSYVAIGKHTGEEFWADIDAITEKVSA